VEGQHKKTRNHFQIRLQLEGETSGERKDVLRGEIRVKIDGRLLKPYLQKDTEQREKQEWGLFGRPNGLLPKEKGQGKRRKLATVWKNGQDFRSETMRDCKGASRGEKSSGGDRNDRHERKITR